ncbi:hypothetical protein H9P43_006012 [Blastocladiella emersonii ATCC 22665]|nr:hypothetical protein H9P43_006012 [Blastocladiella emersonii ATCC 22665]
MDVSYLKLDDVQRADVVVLAPEVLLANSYRAAVRQLVSGHTASRLRSGNAIVPREDDDDDDYYDADGGAATFSQQLDMYVKTTLNAQRGILDETCPTVPSVKPDLDDGGNAADDSDNFDFDYDSDSDAAMLGSIGVVFEGTWFHRLIVFGSEEMVEEPRRPAKRPRPALESFEDGSSDDDERELLSEHYGRERYFAALTKWSEQQRLDEQQYVNDCQMARALVKVLPAFRGSSTIHVTRRHS